MTILSSRTERQRALKLALEVANRIIVLLTAFNAARLGRTLTIDEAIVVAQLVFHAGEAKRHVDTMTDIIGRLK